MAVLTCGMRDVHKHRRPSAAPLLSVAMQPDAVCALWIGMLPAVASVAGTAMPAGGCQMLPWPFPSAGAQDKSSPESVAPYSGDQLCVLAFVTVCCTDQSSVCQMHPPLVHAKVTNSAQDCWR
jgi:hypothetical protein